MNGAEYSIIVVVLLHPEKDNNLSMMDQHKMKWTTTEKKIENVKRRHDSVQDVFVERLDHGLCRH